MQGNPAPNRNQQNGITPQNQQNVNGAANSTAPQAGALNQGRGYPDLGLQMDMNVLWEYIQNLSDLHAGIRSQTQSVLNGVQEVQRRGIAAPSVETRGFEERNGEDTIPDHSSEARQQREHILETENISLREQVSKLQDQQEDQATQTQALLSLLSDYESAITHSLTKLRPFTTLQTTALNAQKAHYLSLLEQERQANLDLRIEQQQFQERLGGVVEMLREALRQQGMGEGPWRQRVKELKAENESLRRIVGIEVDDSEEDEGMGVTDINGSAMGGVLG